MQGFETTLAHRSYDGKYMFVALQPILSFCVALSDLDTFFSLGAIAVAVGYDHTCAAMAGGGVYCWGANIYGQLGTDPHHKKSSLVPIRVAGVDAGRFVELIV